MALRTGFSTHAKHGTTWGLPQELGDALAAVLPMLNVSCRFPWHVSSHDPHVAVAEQETDPVTATVLSLDAWHSLDHDHGAGLFSLQCQGA